MRKTLLQGLCIFARNGVGKAATLARAIKATGVYERRTFPTLLHRGKVYVASAYVGKTTRRATKSN